LNFGYPLTGVKALENPYRDDLKVTGPLYTGGRLGFYMVIFLVTTKFGTLSAGGLTWGGLLIGGRLIEG